MLEVRLGILLLRIPLGILELCCGALPVKLEARFYMLGRF